MKTILTTLLLLVSTSVFSQYLIGKNTKDLLEKGFERVDDSTYVSIGDDVTVITWVDRGEVVLEQYIVVGDDLLKEMYDLIEEYYYIVETREEGIYFQSIKTGVTCVVDHNTFTLFFRE